MIRRLFYCLLKLYWRIVQPRVLGAQALVVRDGKVLLVRLSYTHGWHLPGGGVKRIESFKEAAIRELREECAIEATDLELFGLYHSTKTGKIDHVAVYLVTHFREVEKVAGDPEIVEAKFFPLTELPPETIWPAQRRILEFLGVQPKQLQW